MQDPQLINRELSWLSFNHRVLQEAKDPTVPLYEKIKFTAIFSSNLDEFFRVRVAALRYLLVLKEKSQKKLKFDPIELLEQIHHTVNRQQEELGQIYRNIILKELKKQKIFLVDDKNLNSSQTEYIRSYYKEEVYPFLQPVLLFKNKLTLFLKNNVIYLAVRLYSKRAVKDISNPGKAKPTYAVIEIPSWHRPRFILLPEDNGKHYVMFVDDIIRLCLPDIFHGFKVAESYAIKLTRDAEIYIDDEFSGDLLTKIKKGLSRRKSGVPSRFLYDKRMPKDFLSFLKSAFLLQNEDIVPGGRYHNYSDFFAFPNPQKSTLNYKELIALKMPAFDSNKSVFTALLKKDILIHFPYQSYDYVIRFINQSAQDKTVRSIFITLYRVSAQSQIVSQLIQAAQNGKKVTAFVELKARFDEESNIRWAQEMENAGVKVLYSFPGLKVHAKCCLVERLESGRTMQYAYLGTGNFNEKTSKIYTDIGMFTANQDITKEVRRVYSYLEGKKVKQAYKHLLVAPFNLRSGLYELIDRETENAQSGYEAAITLKLNNLEDKRIIRKLYKASQAGVKVKLLIRGVCCLIPGKENLSENIEAYSILDRFLEHSRIYVFANRNEPLYWLASADWMERNLDRRIEVCFPVYDLDLQSELSDLLSMHFVDKRKVRLIDETFENRYLDSVMAKGSTAQEKIYQYYKNRV